MGDIGPCLLSLQRFRIGVVDVIGETPLGQRRRPLEPIGMMGCRYPSAAAVIADGLAVRKGKGGHVGMRCSPEVLMLL